MALTSKVRQIGNSRGIILPQPVLDQLHWEGDPEVEIQVQGSKLILTPVEYATDDQARASARKVFKNRRRLMERLAR